MSTAAKPTATKSASTPPVESIMLAIGFVVFGILMLLFPDLIGADSYTGGRHGLIKQILTVVWGVKGGLWSLGIGAVYLGWLFRPWRPAPEGEPTA